MHLLNGIDLYFPVTGSSIFVNEIRTGKSTLYKYLFFVFICDGLSFMNMFQKPLAFLLLLSHINFFMFIAQVDEVDCYNADGTRINDVNSLVEYVNDVLLNNKGKSRPDEDDDNARYFHLVKLTCYSLSPQSVSISGSKPPSAKGKKTLPDNTNQKLLSVFYDVATPPPRYIS